MPETLARRWGVEFEFGSNVDSPTLYERLRPAVQRPMRNWTYEETHRGLADPGVRGLHHTEYWTCGYDCGGRELRTPPSRFGEHDGELEAVSRVLRAVGRTNGNWGTHVHIETDDLTPNQRLRYVMLWTALEPGIEALVRRHRRGNDWCGRLRDRVPWRTLEQAVNQQYTYDHDAVDHLYGRALAPKTDHGTSEIRLHHCTLNYRGISNWLKLHMAVIAHAIGANLTFTQYNELYQSSRESQLDSLRGIARDYLPTREASEVDRSIRFRARRFAGLSL